MSTTSAAASSLTPRDSILRPGEAAPDFELTDQNRQPWRLSENLKKGEVVLCFYPMDFSPVCSAEMKCVTEEMARWTAKGAQVVGVSGDSFFTHKAFADQLGLKQTLLADMHRAVCKAYGLYWPDLNLAWRGTVVVGRDGKVTWSQKREIKDAFKVEDLVANL